MKNLTIKKIAFGLFLAGYAASSAFAADLTATSVKSILGNAPLVNAAEKDSATANSVDITVTRNGAPVTTGIQTGDTVKLSWKIKDVDGDTDTQSLTGKTVQFGYKKGENITWTAATAEANGATWAVPAEAKGATAIYYMVRATTDFGLPSAGSWVAGDISKGNGAPAEVGPGVDPTDPSKPTDKPTNPTITDGSGTGGGTVGPEIDQGTGIDASTDSFLINIYKAGDTATSYSASGSTATPKLGETYQVVVTSTGATAADHTADFTYTWFLTGGNAAAGGKVAAGTDVALKSTAATVEIAATNAGLAIAEGATMPEAGAQGFQLKVVAK